MDSLEQAAESVLEAIRKKPAYRRIILRAKGVGIVRTGVELNGIEMWPVRKGQYTRRGVSGNMMGF
jgi:hypothetical protein